MASLLFAVSAGITLTVQGSLNGMLTTYIGALGTSVLGFLIQSILLVAYQLTKKRGMTILKKVPPLYYISGVLATFPVAVTGICVARMGSSVTTCCSVAGQILLSAIVDHFGLFGNRRNRFSAKRLPGFLLILLGVLSINLIGGDGTGDASIGFLLIAMGIGACSIVIRTINYRVTKVTGSVLGGGLVNSLSGMIFGVILYLLTVSFKPDMTAFAAAPAFCYLGGVFGTACLLCNIMAYKTEHIFYSTIFMLIGQIVTGILMDIFLFHSLSTGKCIGIVIVLTGVLLDKLLTREKKAETK